MTGGETSLDPTARGEGCDRRERVTCDEAREK